MASCCAVQTPPGSSRIDIECNSSSCCDFSPSNTLQRSMPAVMDGHFTSHQWTTFCEEIDEALTPVNKAARCLRIFNLIALAAFLGCFLSVFAAIGGVMTGGASSNTGFPNAVFAAFIAAFSINLVGSCVTISYSNSRRQEAIAEMNRVCEETSRLHPGLSFHSRKDTQLHGSGRRLRARMYYYIEVSVATSTNNSSSVPVALATYTPETFAIAGSQTKTPAQRMEELETMRQFLSQEEYDRKKAEIVASV